MVWAFFSISYCRPSLAVVGCLPGWVVGSSSMRLELRQMERRCDAMRFRFRLRSGRSAGGCECVAWGVVAPAGGVMAGLGLCPPGYGSGSSGSAHARGAATASASSEVSTEATQNESHPGRLVRLVAQLALITNRAVQDLASVSELVLFIADESLKATLAEARTRWVSKRPPTGAGRSDLTS